MRRGRERQHSAGRQNLRSRFSECAPDDKRGIRPRQIPAGRDQKRHDHVAAFLSPMDRLVFRLQGKHYAVPGVVP
ncbi:unknown [Sutterella wadsworthensis CAG:135]|nr:unknown [Sutterella wadsworthensis CAG:135]